MQNQQKKTASFVSIHLRSSSILIYQNFPVNKSNKIINKISKTFIVNFCKKICRTSKKEKKMQVAQKRKMAPNFDHTSRLLQTPIMSA